MHIGCRDGYGVEHYRDIEGVCSGGVEWLVGAHRQEHHWQAVGEGADDAARACVGDDEVAVGQQLVLWDVAADVHIPRLWAES